MTRISHGLDRYVKGVYGKVRYLNYVLYYRFEHQSFMEVIFAFAMVSGRAQSFRGPMITLRSIESCCVEKLACPIGWDLQILDDSITFRKRTSTYDVLFTSYTPVIL